MGAKDNFFYWSWNYFASNIVEAFCISHYAQLVQNCGRVIFLKICLISLACNNFFRILTGDPSVFCEKTMFPPFLYTFFGFGACILWLPSLRLLYRGCHFNLNITRGAWWESKNYFQTKGFRRIKGDAGYVGKSWGDGGIGITDRNDCEDDDDKEDEEDDQHGDLRARVDATVRRSSSSFLQSLDSSKNWSTWSSSLSLLKHIGKSFG